MNEGENRMSVSKNYIDLIIIEKNREKERRDEERSRLTRSQKAEIGREREIIAEARFGKYEMTNKSWKDLEVGEITNCRRSGKFNGVSIGRDKDGYFVMTHRARSKSYPELNNIPKKDIKFIVSTG